MKKEATTQEWIDIGAKSKMLHDELTHLIVAISPHIRKTSSVMKNLHKSLHYFDEFCSEAENEMFRQGKEPKEPENPLNVFYGKRD